MKIEELDIEVENVSDFNDEAEHILTSFCEELEARGMTKPIPKDDEWWAEEEGFAFLWNAEAQKLIEGEIGRLYRIGEKYFGVSLDLDISSHMYKEL
jgi:hypothetical protein